MRKKQQEEVEQAKKQLEKMKHGSAVNAKQDPEEDEEYEYGEYDSETQGNIDQSG